MIFLPRMPPEQTASWMGLLDLHERLADGWTLIGGQLVHLHCAQRGQFPVRPTNDADTVIDVRADPTMLATCHAPRADPQSAGASHMRNPARNVGRRAGWQPMDPGERTGTTLMWSSPLVARAAASTQACAVAAPPSQIRRSTRRNPRSCVAPPGSPPSRPISASTSPP